MNDRSVSRLQIVPIRDAFKHEAHDFTVWLAENIEALSERIRIPLKVVGREEVAGDFNVDLVCVDDRNNKIIIENQLERTDHGHLGQLLTYLVNLEARTAIWVATDPRPEHGRVIEWLNQNSPEEYRFFFVRVEAVQIENSRLAPLFTVLIQPDEQSKQTGRLKSQIEMNSVGQDYLAFWTSFLNRARQRNIPGINRTPNHSNWLGTPSGLSGFMYSFVLLRQERLAAVELYIDLKDAALVKSVFDELVQQRDLIDEGFGAQLDWQRLDERRASRIRYTIDAEDMFSEHTWPALHDALIDAMLRLRQTLDPILKTLK